MASSGSITTTGSNRNVTFSWSIQSQSVANNTTTITWQVVGAQDGTDGWYYAGPFSLTINDEVIFTNLYPSGDRIQLRKGTVVQSGTTTIPHSANGTKTFSVTLTAAVYDLNDRTVTGSWTLTTIPRASTATVPSTFTLGTAGTVTISRASSSFYHRVSYKYGSGAETLVSSNVATSTSITFPSNFGSNFASANSGIATIYIRTYPTSSDATNQTNLIGTKTYTTTVNVPSYSLTTPTVTVAETISANTTGVYVQSISKPKFTITGISGQYGSTISSYKVVFAGQTKTSTTNQITLSNPITSSGSLTATITVTDSRGKTATKIQSISVVEYSAPRITVAKAARSTSNAASITCTISCSVSSILNGSTQKNTMSAYALYYTSGSAPSPSSSYKFSTSGLNADNVTKTYTLSGTSTYYIQFRVDDIFGSTTQVVKLGTGGILHITKNGIGILKRRESGALDVGGTLLTDGNIYAGTSDDAVWRSLIARSAAGTLSIYSNGEGGSRGIYTPAHGTGSAKSVLSVDENNNLTLDGGKTPVYLTTEQTISGNKNFTATPRIDNIRSNGPTIAFRYTDAPGTSMQYGSIYLWQSSGTYSANFYFRQYSGTSTGRTSYYDQFYLPTPTDGKNGNNSYAILTSKSAVTVGQGGTGATTAAGARTNLGVNQPASLSSVSVSGNSTATLSITTADYKFYLFKFSCNSVITTIFTTYSQLSTSAQTYYINDGSSTGAPIVITRTASGITVKRDGSTSCSVVLTYWN